MQAKQLYLGPTSMWLPESYGIFLIVQAPIVKAMSGLFDV